MTEKLLVYWTEPERKQRGGEEVVKAQHESDARFGENVARERG